MRVYLHTSNTDCGSRHSHSKRCDCDEGAGVLSTQSSGYCSQSFDLVSWFNSCLELPPQAKHKVVHSMVERGTDKVPVFRELINDGLGGKVHSQLAAVRAVTVVIHSEHTFANSLCVIQADTEMSGGLDSWCQGKNTFWCMLWDNPWGSGRLDGCPLHLAAWPSSSGLYDFVTVGRRLRASLAMSPLI